MRDFSGSVSSSKLNNDEFNRSLADVSLSYHPSILRILFALTRPGSISFRQIQEQSERDLVFMGLSRSDAVNTVIRQVNRVSARNRPDMTLERLGVAFVDDNADDEGRGVIIEDNDLDEMIGTTFE